MAEVAGCAGCTNLGDDFELSTSFVTEDQTLVYYDAPLEGWMRCRSCARRFVFDCSVVLPGLLWHWTLVPSAETGTAESAIRSLALHPPQRWLSLVEDRRRASRTGFTPAWIETSIARPFGLAPARTERS